MLKVNDIYEYMQSIAPEEMAYDTDNVGLLVGNADNEVSKILVSLDITSDVISEAIEIGAELIVSHHPIFKQHSINKITNTDITGKKIIRMLSGGISAICMHTNLDAVRGGVNDALAIAVGIADDEKEAQPLSDSVRLKNGDIVSLGRVGYLKKPCKMPVYLEKLKTALKANGLRYYDSGNDVHKVAVASGSGGAQWENVIKSGCDTFVSAEIIYHMFIEAKERGLNVIDAGHFSTENPITAVLHKKLSAEFPDTKVIISKTHHQIIKFF
ncbi:MAG: Nif3-like dinuclear metal center hexameric protein [Oscillospiraceae bacterium]|jgi:dinuclear metal center YbgI/SA1388 family protein|nr:Nif3-like dinuclear metal center hexameric protein [Oscillospiraceae bacterium]